VGLGVGTWLLVRLTTLAFYLYSTHFFTTLRTCLGLPHPITTHLSQSQCGHTIDDLGTHLFWCPYGSECTTSHNTFQDIVVAIALENGAHVHKEVSTFSFTTLDDEWISLSLEMVFGL
jgi:hypothetical protein